MRWQRLTIGIGGDVSTAIEKHWVSGGRSALPEFGLEAWAPSAMIRG
jgi:hypothetical protein